MATRIAQPAARPAASSAGIVTLTPPLLAAVIRALGDAVTVRMQRANGTCSACREHPAALCSLCADDRDALKEYAGLKSALVSQATIWAMGGAR